MQCEQIFQIRQHSWGYRPNLNSVARLISEAIANCIYQENINFSVHNTWNTRTHTHTHTPSTHACVSSHARMHTNTSSFIYRQTMDSYRCSFIVLVHTETQTECIYRRTSEHSQVRGTHMQVLGQGRTHPVRVQMLLGFRCVLSFLRYR